MEHSNLSNKTVNESKHQSHKISQTQTQEEISNVTSTIIKNELTNRSQGNPKNKRIQILFQMEDFFNMYIIMPFFL